MALCCTSLSAQQRQTDVLDYNKATGYGNIKMPGKINRSWYLGDDGKKVFDGPMSVSCKLNNTNVSIWPYDFTLSGTYTSNFSLAHGKLNELFRPRRKALRRASAGNPASHQIHNAGAQPLFVKPVLV